MPPSSTLNSIPLRKLKLTSDQFEEMVLFTPNNNITQLDLEPRREPDRPQDQAVQSQAVDPLESSSSEPLDENLFSDLTVQFQTLTETTQEAVQISTPEPKPTAIPATSRQNSGSRRKKRAAGLRIGYARDSNSQADDLDADDDSLSLPTSNFVAATPVHDTPYSDSSTVIPPSESKPKSVAVDEVKDEEATPELQLAQSKAMIADKHNRARQSAAAVSSTMKDSISKRRTADDDLDLASVNESREAAGRGLRG